jgi:hypothetical protein
MVDTKHIQTLKSVVPSGLIFFGPHLGLQKRPRESPRRPRRARSGALRGPAGHAARDRMGEKLGNTRVLPWDLWGSLASKGEMFMVILYDLMGHSDVMVMLNVAYWWGFLNGAFGLDIGRLIRDHLKGESCPLRTIVPVTERTVFLVLKSDFALGKSPCLMKSPVFGWWNLRKKYVVVEISVFLLAKPHCIPSGCLT